MHEGGFFKSNVAYIIWFLIYATITFLVVELFVSSWVISILVTLIIYAVSLSVAFSPIGEKTVRKMTKATNITRQDYIEYLTPIFDEVYSQACILKPSISRNIKLFVVDDDTINAFAVGRNTIALNTGAIESLSEQQLRGILAHEFGHLAYGDTKALLLNLVGNGVFSFLCRLFVSILNMFYLTMQRRSDGTLIAVFIKFIYCIFNFCTNIFMGIGLIITSINSRNSEYLADNYAYLIGYGDNLIDVLEVISSVSNNKMSFMEKITASHPYTRERIIKLQSLEARKLA